MNQTSPGWSRLVQSARKVPDTREVSAPYGFATRVAALAFAAERPVVSLFERLSLRAMGLACLLALAAVAANFSSVRHLFDADEAPTVTSPDDPMTTMVDLATS